ncbi:MAG: hypothetical protein LBO78_02675 [Rickettsiales bacterium]|jgi:hypothetical protein|nr:hypothetical protein [Rickettsiales bacterium]
MDFVEDDVRIQYAADGATLGFEYGFKTFSPADVAVYVDNERQEGNFAVEPAEGSNGGTVRFFAAPLSGKTVTILRRLDFKRHARFQTGGVFRAEDLNFELDYQRACLAEVADAAASALKLYGDDPSMNAVLPPAAPGHALVWSADGRGFANQDVDISEKVDFVEDCANTVEAVYGELSDLLGSNPNASLVGLVNNIVGVLKEKYPDLCLDYMSVDSEAGSGEDYETGDGAENYGGT